MDILRPRISAFSVSFLLIAFVLFLNIIPHIYAYQHTPDGMVYSGQATFFDPWDINVYISAIHSGQRYGLLLGNSYTTLENKPIFLYPVYTLIGTLLPNISPILLFHFLSIVCGILLALTLLYVLRLLNYSGGKLFAVFFLIATGGGLGWLIFPNQSPDLFTTGFTFATAFQRPHEAIGSILYLFSLIVFYLGNSKQQPKLVFLSGLASFALIFIYPYYILSYSVICGLYTLYFYIKSRHTYPIFYLICNLIFIVPIALIYSWHLQSNPTLAGVIMQAQKTPDILHLLLGYGILAPLVGYGMFIPKTQVRVFLLIWLLASIGLSYLPFGFGIFYLRMLFFPAVLLAVGSARHLAKRWHWQVNWVLILLLIFVPLTTYYTVYKRVAEVYSNNRWYYIPKEEADALKFLSDQTPPKSGVLAGYTISNLIPTRTYNRVYFGHFFQTPNAQEKINNLTFFYQNAFSEKKALQFLKQNNISYVFWGVDEQVANGFPKNSAGLQYTFLRPVFSEGNVAVFTYK